MKAIMKNIKPKTCANIMNLIQSILVIKDKREAAAIQKLIDKNGFADIYVCCSKDKKNICYKYNSSDIYNCESKKYLKEYDDLYNLNGKVLFKFRCYKVEEILNYGLARRSEIMMKELLEKSCLTMEELNKYAPHKEYEDDYIYVIHITDLEIFDEPKELSEFKHWVSWKVPFEVKTETVYAFRSLSKAPQNFCYVEVE